MAEPVRRRVVIDTDGGVDDAAALWFALLDPSYDVLAITTVWGNVDVAAATASVLQVLHAAGRHDVPVAAGAGEAFGPAPPLRRAAFIHGADGLGDVDLPPTELQPVAEPAVDLLRRVVREQRDVSVITLGPLTNVAHVLTKDREWATAVDELVVMGGSARFGGNALPASEANIGHDPLAAQTVVAAPWQRPPLLVGLDVTHQATLTESEFALLAEHRNDVAAFLDQPLRFYRRFGSTLSKPGECPCHDLLATMALTDAAVITDAPVLPLAVDTGGGAAWGSTVVDFRAPRFAALADSEQPAHEAFHPWRIALEADAAHFRARFRDLLTRPTRP